MAISVELEESGIRVSEKMKRIIDTYESAKEARRQHTRYLRQLHRQFINGEISVDPDDPRTTRGLTPNEVAYIRGEGCEDCGIKCRCDEAFEEAKAQTLLDFAEEKEVV